MAIGMAVKQIIVDHQNIVLAGGQDNITAVQARYSKWVGETVDKNAIRNQKHIYMPMLATAEHVAKVYNLTLSPESVTVRSGRRRVEKVPGVILVIAKLANARTDAAYAG